MAAAGVDGCGLALQIDRGLLSQEGGHGLEGHTEADVLTVADAALDAAAVVGGGGDVAVVVDEDVVNLTAAMAYNVEAVANLKAFHSIDAEHGGTELGVEFAEFRFT